MRYLFSLFIFSPSLLLVSCAPTIQVSTPEPVKIDVNMRVDVHTKNDSEKTTKNEGAEADAPLSSRRRSRMGEIQSIKNSRFVGENRNGYIELRQKPEGKIETGELYSTYVERLIREENNDRRALYLQNAEKEGVPLETIERESAKRWHENACPKEWLQDIQGDWHEK